jgi:hypothetical protein
MYETHWKTVANGFTQWARKGSDSVPCYINNDENEGITVLATVDASARKLRLPAMRKEKTPCCLKNYTLPDDVWTIFSESGSLKRDIIHQYLTKLRHNLCPDRPLALLMDTDSAHRGQPIKDHVQNLEIRLVFIPLGCTNHLLLLDRTIFGVLKASAHRLWYTFDHQTKGGKSSQRQIAEHLVSA